MKCFLATILAGAALLSPAALSPVAQARTYHSGQFCTLKKQRQYKRHGYVCKKAKDGRYRLFKKKH